MFSYHLNSFSLLSQTRRDSLFQIRVALQDVEDYDPDDPSKVKFIMRQNVIPLPRSFEEAADWGTRYVWAATNLLHCLSLMKILQVLKHFYVYITVLFQVS